MSELHVRLLVILIERRAVMSIMCCAYVREGIIMATDSRLVVAKSRPANAVYPLSDNAQKVLWLKNHNTGVAFCGNAMNGDMMVSDYISLFERKHLNSADSPREIANKIASNPVAKQTHFLICGFKKDVPFVYDVKYQKVERLNASEEADANVKYGVVWSGQKAAITKIMKGDPPFNVNWNLMSLKDAIDFVEFLVNTTIQYERFNDALQSCGGNVDILVLTSQHIFWHQHKIYAPKHGQG